jgi:hypothetical protein
MGPMLMVTGGLSQGLLPVWRQACRSTVYFLLYRQEVMFKNLLILFHAKHQAATLDTDGGVVVNARNPGIVATAVGAEIGEGGHDLVSYSVNFPA